MLTLTLFYSRARFWALLTDLDCRIHLPTDVIVVDVGRYI